MGAGELVLVALSVLLAAATQSLAGFGFALLAVPLLALAIPTGEAVVLATTMSLVTSAAQAVGLRDHGDRPVMGRMLGGVVVGAPFGLLAASLATGRQLRFALAAVILAFLVMTVRGVTLHRAGRGVDVGAGVVAGVLSTSLATNGPPVVMGLHTREMAPDHFRGTIAGVFTGANLLALVLFALAGRIDRDVLVLTAVALPALGVGYLVGARQRPRFDPVAFRRLTLVLLAVTAVITLAGAIAG